MYVILKLYINLFIIDRIVPVVKELTLLVTGEIFNLFNMFKRDVFPSVTAIIQIHT